MSGEKRLGKFEIHAALGKGARASVYRGLDTESRRAVAVKVIPREMIEPRALPAFKAYAPGLSLVEHPGIASFIDILQTENNVVLVSALAEGQPLATLLKDGAYPEPRTAWEILRQILEALASGHDQGVVHRDLKPANIMLAANGRVTLLDFGTSMLFAAPGEVLAYCGPEHFTDRRFTTRSDIYQVGVLAYQLLTGKLPFAGTPPELQERVLRDAAMDPSSHNNKLAAQIDVAIRRALAKSPDERFETAVEFGDALRLGLQDTVGRPLEPVKPPEDAIPMAPDAVPTPAATAPAHAATAPAAPARAAPVSAPAAAAAPAPVKLDLPPSAPMANLVQNAKLITPAATRMVPDASKPTLLFVDDDPRILVALVALFRQDYRVMSAESGEAALALIAQRTPHIVVTDQRMPGMTGVELLRKVREAAPNAVRILLTGYTDLAALVGSINQGEIFRFVKKPWDNDELRTAVSDAAKIALELASTPAPRPHSPRSAGSLLVIEPGNGIARGLERLLAGAATVKQVATPQEAAKVLAREEIACIVADMGTGMDGLVALFRQLKAKRPEVLSILLTDEPDSELAIELINRAHIFRFLPKPVSGRALRAEVATALRRYSAFKQIPTLKAAVPGSSKAAGTPAPADADTTERARTAPAALR